MSTIQPENPPTREWHSTWADLNDEIDHSDCSDEILEQRVVLLEHALVSWRARRRLRRSLRRSAAAYRWTGSFDGARTEQAGFDYHVQRGRHRAGSAR